MDPGGLRQGKVRSQEVTTSTLDTPSTFRSISPKNSAQIFTQLARFCMRAVEVTGRRFPLPPCRVGSMHCNGISIYIVSNATTLVH